MRITTLGIAAVLLTGCGTASSSTAQSQGLITTTTSSSSAPTTVGTSQPTTAPTPVPTPVPVAAPLTFTASGSKQTPGFHVNGGFTLSWTSQATSACSNVITTASLYQKGKNPNSDAASAGPFFQQGCDPYTTEVNVGADDYFLNLDAANETATFTVTFH